MRNRKKRELQGLGGWMILVQIVLILRIVTAFFGVMIFFSLIFDAFSYITFFILALVAFILYFYSSILMYLKNKKFPNIFIFSLWYDFVLGTFALIFFMFVFLPSSEEITYNVASMIGGLVANIIITIYLKNSKRVKNTFVN